MPNLFWIILVVIVVVIVGGAAIYLRQGDDAKDKAGLGSALLTGGLIALAFWGLQNVNEGHQQKLAHQQAQREGEVARRQSLLITVGLQKDLTGADLAGANLAHINLSGKTLEGADLHEANLTKARLIGTNLRKANLDNAVVAHANLEKADLREAVLNGTQLQQTYMFAANLVHAKLGPGASNRPANLTGATLINANAHGACFADANLTAAKISGADFTEAILTDADLTKAQLEYDGIPLNLRHSFTYQVKVAPSPLSKQLLATGSWHSVPLARVAIPSSAVPDHVVQVINADTIQLRRRGDVRLLGLGVPSTEKPVGGEAASYVQHLVPPGSPVFYRLGPEPREPLPLDVGRWLAYVWTPSGLFLNQALVEKGFAHRETKHAEYHAYATVLAGAERNAKATATGLWSTCPE